MNKPVQDTPVSVKLPPSAVVDLNRRVGAGEFGTLDEAVTAALLELEHFRAVELVGGEAAFQALALSVEADGDPQVGEVDAFEFLHDLKDEYRRLAEIREGRA
jgi:Arc/MetJ-type ribon-helix-helix transcriptional regulator